MQQRKPSLLFDLQSLQNGSSTRGIGRYTREHLRGLLGAADFPFELHCSLDLTYERQAGEVLGEFADRLAADRLHGYRYPAGLWSAFPTNEPETVLREELVRLHVEAMAPDVVHVPSLFEGAVEACASLGRIARARGSLTSCLVHDLIPLVMSDCYLSDPRVRDWYQHKVSQLREFDVLLANSQSSKDDAVRLLDLDPERVHVIYAGYSEIFRPAPDSAAARARLVKRFGLAGRYVLYTGNNDYRKNTRGAIAGFAAVPPSLRQGMKLVLNQAEQVDELRQFAQQCDLEADAIVVTGYVTDAELVDLYACCNAFVFPSLYEGFGLPVVEAMACGAPVVVGDNSSLKEIMALDEARFDASSPLAIAAALQRVLVNDGWRSHLQRYGLEQVKSFSWQRTAQLSIAAWQAALERRESRRAGYNGHSKVAIVFADSLPVEAIGGWVDRISLFGRTNSVEIASRDTGQWPAYMQVQAFPEQPLVSDLGLDLVLALHCSADGATVHGLAFPGERAGQVHAQWSALRALLAQGQMPAHDHALPELIAECLGVLEAGPQPVPLAAAIAPMLRRVPVQSLGDAAQPHTALDWAEAVRAKYAPLSSAGVATLLKPTLSTRSSSFADAIYESLCSVGNFGAPRRVLIDMSEMARIDYGTGIQRVVRNLVRELCSRNAEGRVLFLPVYHEGERIRSAHMLVKKTLGVECPAFDEAEGIRSRDMLFLADSAWVGPERFLPSIGKVRRNGGEVAVFFHDIIPLRFPQTCGDGMPGAFRAWTEFAVRHADVFVCNSRTTAEDLSAWIAESGSEHRANYRIGYVHLGSDVMEVGMDSEIRPSISALFEAGTRTFLAVGTMEPRKDYRTILKAFETAWTDGLQANLLIIGKDGWGSEELVAAIRNSPQFGKRLFWPEKVNNAELDLAYRSANGLIQASLSEGFGLPIVEAARHGTPLLLSDIAVFREIAGEHAAYFPVGDSAALAALLQGPELAGCGLLAARILSWRDYGRELRALLLQGAWLQPAGAERLVSPPPQEQKADV
ncbi:glycosyltransferase family 4 protein [Pseudoxanthomonas winnipegensis]|nr:glycosyltransferase family 1 protein [Pseudoxanthomonas winnipegensis]